MKHQYNDGGRSAAGLTGRKGDCVCRSVSIATGQDYRAVWNRLAMGNLTQRKRRKDCRRFKEGKAAGKASADYGVNIQRTWFKKWITGQGWEWVPCMGLGTGCKVHLRAEELPPGRLIVRLSKHVTCVIDGVIHDTYDPSRNETRCVYGYYREKKI